MLSIHHIQLFNCVPTLVPGFRHAFFGCYLTGGHPLRWHLHWLKKADLFSENSFKASTKSDEKFSTSNDTSCATE